MIRATLDVNVLASGFPAERGTPSALIDLWVEGAFELVISEHILRGLARAWSKPYFRLRYRADQAERAVDLLRSGATIVGCRRSSPTKTSRSCLPGSSSSCCA